MPFKTTLIPVLSTAIAVLATASALAASPQVYLQPSSEVLAVLDAKGLPGHVLSPDQKTLGIVELRRYRQVAELARPILRLAGKRIDAAANGPQLTPVIESIRLRELTQPGAAARTVQLPSGGSFYQMRWSPDSKHFLLHRRTAQATELWIGDTATAKIRQIKGVKLNSILEDAVAWVGADEMIALTVPERRGPAPQFEAPFGPSIQESMGRDSPERTLQDLLKNSQDEALFTHYATSSLRRIALRSGVSRQIGEPGLYAGLQVVGSTGLLLTERLVPPFSYQVIWDDFARQVELLDTQGKRVRALGAIKLKESVPVEGVITGPRNYWASPYADAAVYWVEALDGGDLRNKVPQRDRLMRLDPPYQGEGQEVHRTAGRMAGLSFVEGGSRLIVSDIDRDRLWLTTDLLTLDGSAKPLRVQDRSMRDRYKDAGQPVLRVLPNGRSVARLDAGQLWLVGSGASAAGDRPFLDRMSIADGKSTRLFQSSSTHFERPMAVLADSRLVTSRETFAEPPNLMLRSGPDFA